MPPNATDDGIERLVFLAKVETGLAELDGGSGHSARSGQTAFWSVLSRPEIQFWLDIDGLNPTMKLWKFL
jgi:hypothetical protein